MIDLNLTVGRFQLHLTWKREAKTMAPAADPAPVNAGYPMRSTAVGFNRRPVVR